MTEAKPLTGRKVLFILLAAFGVILTANITLLVNAVRTFPGLEVKNSYVASQTFNVRAQAQAAMGWAHEVDYADGTVSLTILSDGVSIFPETVSLRIGRPTHGREDTTPVLLRDATGYWFNIALNDGKWFVYVNAETETGETFAQRLELFVTDGDG